MQLHLEKGQASLPDRREYQSSGVRFNIPAVGHHDEAEYPEEQHDRDTLWATPDIDYLGERQFRKSSDDARDHSRRRCQGV